jgi:hypothetical protein
MNGPKLVQRVWANPGTFTFEVSGAHHARQPRVIAEALLRAPEARVCEHVHDWRKPAVRADGPRLG